MPICPAVISVVLARRSAFFVFKIIGQPGIKGPNQRKGKRVAISQLGRIHGRGVA